MNAPKDAAARLRDRGIEPLTIVRTDPQPGHRIIAGHRTLIVNDNGGYDVVQPSHPSAGPAYPLHVQRPMRGWEWAVCAVVIVAFVAWCFS